MSLAGLRVLLVEDEMLVAMTLEEVLQDAGCVVVGPYPRVELALKAANDEKIDAAVLDVNLAGQRVYPLADLLASLSVPFVFMTGYAPGIFPPRFRDRPILPKPFSPERLTSELSAVVGLKDPLRTGK